MPGKTIDGSGKVSGELGHRGCVGCTGFGCVSGFSQEEEPDGDQNCQNDGGSGADEDAFFLFAHILSSKIKLIIKVYHKSTGEYREVAAIFAILEFNLRNPNLLILWS